MIAHILALDSYVEKKGEELCNASLRGHRPTATQCSRTGRLMDGRMNGRKVAGSMMNRQMMGG